jgi:CheY-like chemotaxis protein
VMEAMRFEGLDVHLEVVNDGERAIQMLDRVDAGSESALPTLLLLDVNVPRKSGTEVLERLRRSPRCGEIPVVMISSSDSPLDRKRAFDLGATEYFHKPSSLMEFMQLGKLVRRLHEKAWRRR